MASNDQCVACMEPIFKQTVDLISCAHNCFCEDCALTYFKKENKCPICRKQIDETIVINGKIIYLTEIYCRSRSNTESYLFGTRSISTYSERPSNSPSLEPSENSESLVFDDEEILDNENSENEEILDGELVICSLCSGELDINYTSYQQCGCEINKSVACDECMENNPQLTAKDICDHRCQVSIPATESEYHPSLSVTITPNRNHGEQTNAELKDNLEENDDNGQNMNHNEYFEEKENSEENVCVNLRENDGLPNDVFLVMSEEDEGNEENVDANSEQNDKLENQHDSFLNDQEYDQNLDEIDELFEKNVDTNSEHGGFLNDEKYDQNLNKINKLFEENVDKIDQDKTCASLDSLLYDETNANINNGVTSNIKKNEEQEEQKNCSVEISETLSISYSEEDKTPTPAYQSSQINNVGNRNKNGFFFYAPDMSESPAKLPASTCQLLLTTEESNSKKFPMIISSFRKRSLRKSLSIERKIELESIKEEMSDDSELDLIIGIDSYENPKKKQRLN